MTKIIFTGPKVDSLSGWSRKCQVAGFNYHVAVQRGKRVRIAFKPRGQNIGFHWHGSVYREGKQIWAGRVPKSIGVRGLLVEAGALDADIRKASMRQLIGNRCDDQEAIGALWQKFGIDYATATGMLKKS